MLDSKEMIAAGIKPCELFGKLMKSCSTIEEALGLWNKSEEERKATTVSRKMIKGSFWWWLCNNVCFEGFVSFGMSQSTSKSGIASNSEKRRWLQSGSVRVNNQFPQPDDIVEFPIFDLVIFPNSKNRVTMI